VQQQTPLIPLQQRSEVVHQHNQETVAAEGMQETMLQEDERSRFFQCYGEAKNQNQFTRTIDELDSYVGLQFKHSPGDIKKMIKTSMTDAKIAALQTLAIPSILTNWILFPT
jgi:hypothetical protein